MRRALCNNDRAMRPEITTIVLGVLAIAFGIAAYLRDPGLPWIGVRSLAFPVLAGWLVHVFYQE